MKRRLMILCLSSVLLFGGVTNLYSQSYYQLGNWACNITIEESKIGYPTLTYYATHYHYTRCGTTEHKLMCSDDLDADGAYQCSIGSIYGSGRGTYTGDCGISWVWRTFGSCLYGS